VVRTAVIFAIVFSTFAAAAAPNSSSHQTKSPSQPTPQAQSRDYQSWLHRHDSLAQYNTPKGLDPTWYHRHDELRQFNPPK
jgi:invasion protein IalB